MSRIGKKSVGIAAGVKVAVKDGTVNVEGPKGKLSIPLPKTVAVKIDESAKAVNVSLASDVAENDKQAKADWGSTRAHIRNMIEGCEKGYEKRMEVVGVGWTAAVNGKELKMMLGFANAILMTIPTGLVVKVDKQIVSITGPDKQLVGQFASAMRQHRKPEPYNGKGVKYVEEVIRRKQGKQFGA